jgi:YHS domain-containing protein
MTSRRLLLLVSLMAALPPARAATTERFIADRTTGLALSGVDPVSYFTNHAPMPGKAEHEARWAGIVWRFANGGNRAAFLDTPDAYAPRFGGHDPVAASRGRVAEGDPDIFLIAEARLYLFQSEETRVVFEMNPNLAADAERAWPRLVTGLSR